MEPIDERLDALVRNCQSLADSTRALLRAATEREASGGPMAPTYDTDLAAWAEDNAQRLRTGDFANADIPHIAEELETLGRSQRAAIRDRTITIMEHMLKLHLNTSPRILEYNRRGWERTIIRAQEEIDTELDVSPSLKTSLTSAVLLKAYERAARRFLAEEFPGALPVPAVCPYTWREVLGGTE